MSTYTPIKAFPWGTILNVQDLADYRFITYRDKVDGNVLVHLEIAGRTTSRSFFSLESAMVGAVALVREGANSKAAEYFDLMTGIDPNTGQER